MLFIFNFLTKFKLIININDDCKLMLLAIFEHYCGDYLQY
jgi:hypothetical protein